MTRTDGGRARDGFAAAQAPRPDAERLEALEAEIDAAGALVERIVDAMQRTIIGQRTLLERLLLAYFANGHLLIEGVPGLAKTRAVTALAEALEAHFQRIQFTPDLLPADLVGTQVFRPNTGEFEVHQGPVFANLVLADEINRAPAKVQSALLEAMQEGQVTIGEQTFPMPQPFMVLATQNPLEQEGTYPLPEAQMDRFMMKLVVGYPDRDDELEILRRMARTTRDAPLEPVATLDDVVHARSLVEQVHIDAQVESYIVDLVLATRDPAAHGLDCARYIEYGASPRASIYLALVSKAHAFLDRRAFVTPHDVKQVAMDVLRHRVLPTFEAEADEVPVESLIARVLDTVPVP